MVRHSGSFDAFLEPWSPPWASAIADACRASDPAPHLRPLLAELGFDGLTCIALSPTTAGEERALYAWSTAPPGWSVRYCDHGYATVDPRVTMTARRLSPIIWDAADVDGDWHVQRFLADAARYGMRGGFAVSFRDTAFARVVVAFDSATSPLTDAGCATMIARLGDLMLLAAALHERVLRPRCAALHAVPRTIRGALTARERECLRMAASGLTSGDMGSKLGIAERTVNFHMGNVLRKLEALNRPEAIAKAMAGGVLLAGGS